MQIDSLVHNSESLNLIFNIQNVGYAAPTQYKPIKIALKNLENNTISYVDYIGTNADIRYWFPGNIELTGTIYIPDSLESGDYLVGIYFPDQSTTLADNPAYAIQLANVSMWDNNTGINWLGYSVVINESLGYTIPNKPENIDLQLISASQLGLTWNDVATNELGYEIYRCENENYRWELIANLEQNATEFIDVELNTNTSYSYIVRTYNEYGQSEFSKIVTGVPVSINSEVKNNNILCLYPNPSEYDAVEIEISNNGIMKRVMITDMAGRIFFRKEYATNYAKINTIGISKGIYIVIVITNKNQLLQKLLILE